MRQAQFHLTRRAARDLQVIHRYSVEEWGEEKARAYINTLYAAMGAAADKPETGLLRQHRSHPFLMVPAGRHYIVYDNVDIGIVILTILHQRRNIEQVISGFTPDFMVAIDELRSQADGKS